MASLEDLLITVGIHFHWNEYTTTIKEKLRNVKFYKKVKFYMVDILKTAVHLTPKALWVSRHPFKVKENGCKRV